MNPKVSPEQGTLLSHDPLQNRDVPNPEIDNPLTRPKAINDGSPRHDPNPGLTSPLAEGWGVMHDVITDIARERSNRGFVTLPVGNRRVHKFAHDADVAPHEAQDLVDHASGKKYEKAQGRLNLLRDKQVKRALGYNAFRKIVDNEVITDMMPLAVGNVEHRFFYANGQAEERAKQRNRQAISRFVKKHRP